MSKKWFPGHYIMADPDVTPNLALKPWQRLSGPYGYLFAGIKQYIAWRRIEPTLGTFTFAAIHALLDSLPTGKKAIISLASQGWDDAIVPVPCPADMVGNPTYDGGYRVKVTTGGNVPNATLHMPATMERYLAMVQAVAEEFDADERVALFMTMEIPYDPQWAVKPPSGQYNDATFAAQLYKLAQVFPTFFTRTPCGSLGAWWAPAPSTDGADADRRRYARYWLDAGAGFGIPDCVAVDHPRYNSNFRPDLLANAGLWPCFMGMEWADFNVGTGTKDYGGLPWPQAHIDAANLVKANFMWWNTGERQNSFPIQPDGSGGRGFDAHLIPYLQANPGAGITTTLPRNIDSALTARANVSSIEGTPLANILSLDGTPIANVSGI